MSAGLKAAIEAGPIEVGFECSDMDSFYSSAHGGFGNQARVDERGGLDLQLAHGHLRVVSTTTPTSVLHEIEVLEDSWLYDCVARWVFDSSCASFGQIANELVPHGSTLYHEHETTDLELGELRIGVHPSSSFPEGMRQSLYLRSEGERWIVHARVISREQGENVRLFVKSTNGHSELFEGSPVEARVLMRRREFAAAIYETQIQPHVRLPAGSRFAIGLTRTQRDQ